MLVPLSCFVCKSEYFRYVKLELFSGWFTLRIPIHHDIALDQLKVTEWYSYQVSNIRNLNHGVVSQSENQMSSHNILLSHLQGQSSLSDSSISMTPELILIIRFFNIFQRPMNIYKLLQHNLFFFFKLLWSKLL